MNEARTIFISHATPDDNHFVWWLSLRLMSMGYNVWCDLLNLSKGGDFWKEIEAQIRTNTCKFLLVQSVVSNSRDGVAKEIAVAQKVGKSRGDLNFIIPLRIDTGLSYDDVNVDLIRLNSIDFTNSWATGLKELVEALQKQSCPRCTDSMVSDKILDRLICNVRMPICATESYDSNWFRLEDLPETLNFFPIRDKAVVLNEPFLLYKNCIVTFLEKENLPESLKSYLIPNQTEHRLRVKDYLEKDLQTDFIWSSTLRRLYVGVLAKVFDCSMRLRKGVRCHVMSKGVAFLYPQGVLEKDKVGRIQLIGKHKQLHWHFAISGSIRTIPFPLLQVRTHVVFSSNGRDISLPDSVQHRARRSIGKSWWNKDWRARLLAFMKSLECYPEGNHLDLVEGVERPVRVCLTPVQFESNVTYSEPGKEAEEEQEDTAASDDFVAEGNCSEEAPDV
ncbi:MAG: toll/interleukin-1 receptor domain-containing protein [Kiritimatiellia bacterium]